MSLELYNASRERERATCGLASVHPWVPDRCLNLQVLVQPLLTLPRCSIPVAAPSPPARVMHDPSPPLTVLTACLHYKGCRPLVLRLLDPDSWATGYGAIRLIAFFFVFVFV